MSGGASWQTSRRQDKLVAVEVGAPTEHGEERDAESSRNRAHEESGDHHLGAEGGCAGQQPTGGAKNARRARRESARLEPPVCTQVAHQGGGVVEPESIASRDERDRGEAQSVGRSVPDRAEGEERVDEEEERHKDRRCTQLASDCQSCQHRGGDEVTARSPRRGGAAERPVPKEKKKKGRQQQKERERTAMGERSAMAGAWKEDEDRERTTRGWTFRNYSSATHERYAPVVSPD